MWKLGSLVSALLVGVSYAFRNPIIPGFNPDPSIIRVEDDYFLVTSTFEFFPGVPVYHSKDLIDWTCIGHALNRPSQLNMRGTAPSGGIFAPTLRYHKASRTYYMITTWFDVISPPDNVTRTPRSMYVKTKNIMDESSWSDPIYVDQAGFDPDLFFDDNSKTYLTTTQGSGFVDPDSGYFAIWITEIGLATGDSLTESRYFYRSELPISTPRLAEGSHIYKFNGMYYLLTAEAGTEVQHRAMFHRSRSLSGPWEASPYNPFVFNGRDLSNPILATGHADIVQTKKGDWYAVFLAIRPQNPTNSSGINQLGRETFLAPVTWKDGWPIANNGNDITFQMPGLYNKPRPKYFIDDFSKGRFADKKYYTQRTPYKAFHSFTARKGWLRLRGNVYTPSDRETPAMFLRKQEDINTIFSTEIDFYPTSKYHKAGVTSFLSVWIHQDIIVTLHPDTGKRVVAAVTRTGKEPVETTIYKEIPSRGTVKLYIKCEASKYSLGYAVGNGKVNYIASVSNKWMQSYPQGWQNFVGTHLGIFSTGAPLPMLVPADFKYIKTEGGDW
ncbi:Beta-xylosidase [Dactylella cylindrospora]|nr:Beta-xylosidase [Dactylella cylindrospora]